MDCRMVIHKHLNSCRVLNRKMKTVFVVAISSTNRVLVVLMIDGIMIDRQGDGIQVTAVTTILITAGLGAVSVK